MPVGRRGRWGWVGRLEVEHNMLESPEENCGLDRVGPENIQCS